MPAPALSDHPVIGITAMAMMAGERPVQAVHEDYVAAVVAAGGLAHILPVSPQPEPEALLARLDGLILSGGGDVDPAMYGQEARPETAGIDGRRDRMELGFVHHAVALGLPVLGICRGCQVLNVALGGTLIQHLPDTGRDHLTMTPRSEASHPVVVVPGSLLRDLVETDEVGANSFHHQGIDRLAADLMPVGRAPDGLVEAVAHVNRPMLGVQWHPENMAAGAPEQAALFRWLVRAAAEYRRAPEPAISGREAY